MRKKTKDEKYIEILDNAKKGKKVKKKNPHNLKLIRGGKS